MIWLIPERVQSGWWYATKSSHRLGLYLMGSYGTPRWMVPRHAYGSNGRSTGGSAEEGDEFLCETFLYVSRDAPSFFEES